MSLSEIARVLSDQVFGRRLREHYWAAAQTKRRLYQLRNERNRAFARTVRFDFAQFLLKRTKPEADGASSRARAAVEWILRAQSASSDSGVSLGYFPCDFAGGWHVSYPETTGYIITSLLAFSTAHNDSRVAERALAMADWESEIQMPTGAVQGGPVCVRERQKPCAFNTGMVLDGWVSAWNFTGNSRFLESALRAADWLIADLTPQGYFRTNGEFVAPGHIKTYNVLCAWAIHRLGEHLPSGPYRAAAIRIAEAGLLQQQPNGWFSNNCLTRPEAPLVHTIAYTLQGILEVGIAAGREDLVEACRRAANALLPKISADGFLAGRFFSNWSPACFSSCLTGSAQLAVVFYRLFEHTRDARYLEAAERLLNYLKPLQLLNSDDEGVKGALPGSFPIFGGYMTAGYPNWATKYLLDALMLQERLA